MSLPYIGQYGGSMGGAGSIWTAPRIIHFASEEGYPEPPDPEREEYERLKAKFEKDSE